MKRLRGALTPVPDLLVVLRHHGINGPKMRELRVRATALGARMEVVKNTLARRAIADLPCAALAPSFEGPCILISAVGPPEPRYRGLLAYLRGEFPNVLRRKAAGPDSAQKGWGWTSWRDGYRANSNEIAVAAVWMYGALLSPGDLAIVETRDRGDLHAALVRALRAPPSQLLRLLEEPPRRLLALLGAERPEAP